MPPTSSSTKPIVGSTDTPKMVAPIDQRAWVAAHLLLQQQQQQSTISTTTPAANATNAANATAAAAATMTATAAVTPTITTTTVKLDPANIQATCHYVAIHHPHHGCSTSRADVPSVAALCDLSIAQMATYADAVAVCCVDVLGDTQLDEELRADPTAINSTAFANIAYIAMHHSSAATRATATSGLREWISLLRAHHTKPQCIVS